tara:strand:+ start:21970 stop:23166 length:1197 start_codon:yes stop_codon:yes gene_type:complete
MIKQHLPHLDDLLVERGLQGVTDFSNHVEHIIKHLIDESDPSTQIGQKVDGSMMVLAGSDPFTGDFFVSTKSGLSQKNPRRCFCHADIEHYYEDMQGDVYKTLLAVFDALVDDPRFTHSYVYQMEVLWWDINQLDIDREMSHVSLTPNIIPYHYSTIHHAKDTPIGLVVHDRYTPFKGEGQHMILDKRSRAYDINVINRNENVTFFDGTITIDAGFRTHDIITIQAALDGLVKPEFYSDLFLEALPKISKYLQKYLRSTLLQDDNIYTAAKAGDSINHALLLKDFVAWLRDVMLEEASKLKTSKGQQRKKDEFNRLHMLMCTAEIESVIWKIYWMVRIKGLLLDHLENGNKLNSILQPGLNYSSNTIGEGFVHFMGDDHVKLVDKLYFTKTHIQHNRK